MSSRHNSNLENFYEDSEVEYTVIAVVNNEVLETKITGHDFDSVAEQWHKLEGAVNELIVEQFEDQEPDYDSVVKHERIMEEL